MLANLRRILRNYYELKKSLDPAYCGQLAGEIDQQLNRYKGGTPTERPGVT